MKISILIPTKNRFEMVKEAILEIIKYDHDSVLEVIVSENYSIDNSFERLTQLFKGFSKFKIIRPKNPCNPIENWENCLNHANGTHIHWHWSDDKLATSFYQKAEKLSQMENASIVMGPVKMWYLDGFSPIFYSQKDKRKMKAKDALKHLLSDGTLPYSPAAYILPAKSVRNHFYKEIPIVENFNPNKFAMGADALMIAGSLLEESEIYFLDDPVMCFRHHEESISVKHTNQFKNYHIAFEFFQDLHKTNLFSKEERIKIYGETIVQAVRPTCPPETRDKSANNFLQKIKIFKRLQFNIKKSSKSLTQKPSQEARTEANEFFSWLQFAVPGMLTPSNIDAMAFAFQKIPSGKSIVEIGSFAGLSLIILGYLKKKYSPKSQIFSCDEWQFEGQRPGELIDPLMEITHDNYKEFVENNFKKNISLFLKNDLPHTIKCSSKTFFKLWRQKAIVKNVFGTNVSLGGEIGFAYIDGNHTYQGVTADFNSVDQFISKGGFILFDDSADIGAWQDVNKLMKEIIKNRHYKLVSNNPNYLFQKIG